MADNDLFLTLADDSWQRAYHAMVLSAGALSLGRQVTLFAGGRSVLALAQGRAALKDPVDDVLLAERSIPSFETLRESVLALGATCLACETGMKMAGLTREALLEGVKLSGVVSFLIAAGERPVLAL